MLGLARANAKQSVQHLHCYVFDEIADALRHLELGFHRVREGELEAKHCSEIRRAFGP